MLPQQGNLKRWFETPIPGCRDLNINDPRFIQCVPPPCHNGKGGLHSNQDGPGTNWNAVWEAWINSHRSACNDEILRQLNVMIQMFSGPLNCQQ
jgi:hypothetical protein